MTANQYDGNQLHMQLDRLLEALGVFDHIDQANFDKKAKDIISQYLGYEDKNAGPCNGCGVDLPERDAPDWAKA